MISTKRKRRDSSTSRTRAAVLAATLCTAALALAAAGCGGSPGSGVAQIGSTCRVKKLGSDWRLGVVVDRLC